MSTPTAPVVAPRLVSAIVVRVEEEKCYVTSDGSIIVVDYAPQFPSHVWSGFRQVIGSR